MRLRFLVLILLWSCVASAQPPRHFRHFTEKDGLSDNRVQAILRDRQGFLWIGTANGLNRFDGYALRQYFPDPQHPEKSLSSEFINDLQQDTVGRMWIATNRGLNCYDPTNCQFRSWTNVGRNDGSLPNAIIWNILFDQKGRLWLSCDNRDLCRYDAATDRFVTYPWRAFVRKSLPATAPDAYLVIYGLRLRGEHGLWLSTNLGVFSFDWESEQFTFHPYPAKFELAEGLSPCPDITYFGTWDSDILRYDGCTQQWRQIKLPLGADQVGGRRLVNALLPYQNGYCLLARRGMFWMPQADERVAVLAPAGEAATELPTGMLTDGYLDEDSALWVGGEEGLWLAEPQQRNFVYTALKPKVNDDFYNTYGRMLDLPGGYLLALDFYYHALHVLKNGVQIAKIDLPPKAGLLYRDAQGQVWVGGGNEIFRFDLAQLRLQAWPIPEAVWPTDRGGYFQDMTQDGAGNYWFAHDRQGLLVWNPKADTWWMPDSSAGFIGKHVTSVVADRNRNIVWIGTEDYGLFKYDERRRIFTLYQHDPKRPTRSLGAFVVLGMCLDPRGMLWVATDPGGVTRVDPDAAPGQEFWSFGVAAGLPSNRATSVVCDRRGRIWVGTLSGVACIDEVHGRIRTFTLADGLLNEFMDMPLTLGADGRIRNGMVYGYQSFDPEQLLQEHRTAAINLTSFKIFAKELRDSMHLADPEGLALSWRENFFSFEFSSADVLAARKTVYAYRLQGFDPAWIEIGHRHQVSYTNVTPGDYVLEIKSGIEGQWNAVGFRLPIHIAPPFWITWWFRIAVLLVVAGIVYGLYRLRIRQVKREEALKTEFNQRIARTEMAALRAQMNPHFVFNCLSSINRFIMVNQPEEASAYLTKFSRLIRLILDNSRSETVLLSKELDALRLYIEMEQMRFSDRFDYSIEIDPRLQVEHLEVPPLLMQPYVENAIWHGLMHKKSACMLRIRLFPTGKRLCIEIEDNGVGRAKAMALKSRSATLQKSHGMKVTSERIEVINRLYGTDATVTTTDLTDADGEAAGTRIQLTL